MQTMNGAVSTTTGTAAQPSLFHKGFAKYLQNGTFSDLTLVCNNAQYKVHKVILSYCSEYFNRLFSSEFKEKHQPVIELKYEDTDNVFPTVLNFMYEGQLSVTSENAIPLLAMADHYLINDLKKLCSDFILATVTRENAVVMLKKAIRLHAEEVVKKCIQVIARNFFYIYDADYSFLDPNLFFELLQSKYLAVKSEYALYKTVVAYINAHKDDLEPKQITDLFETIRFRWMSFEELQECEVNPMVPRHVIIEALMCRLKPYESPTTGADGPSVTNIRLQRRVSYGIQFEYRQDFDDQGILYWIGTNGGRSDWTNPHLANFIKVTASSIEKGRPCDLVGRTATEMWTKDVPASWFSVDLGTSFTVVPTMYSLRHGGNYKADSLRTWDFQGSTDGKQWTLLKRHANDCSLNANFATHTWTLTGITQPFRYFRILQTGHNSSNHNFLVLSGFELYGDLYESFD